MKRNILRMLLTIAAAILMTCVTQLATAGTLKLPSQMKIIEDSAFEGDMGLDEIVFPDGLREIHDRAFADSSAADAFFPDSLTWISDDAFDNAPGTSFRANRGSYAYNWLKEHRFILSFVDETRYDFSMQFAIVEDDEELRMHTDSFVAVYELAELDWWKSQLTGDPVWEVRQISGTEMTPVLQTYGSYMAQLNVEMPSRPGTAVFEVSCSWGGKEAVSRAEVSYVYPNVMPDGTDIPDYMFLTPEEENAFILNFTPSFFNFSEYRVGLENYTGEADCWYWGNSLYIVPHNEGTFTGTITLYAGNIYIEKDVIFRVKQAGDGPDLAVEASRPDLYTLSWTRDSETDAYTVSAYLDEDCSECYLSKEVSENYTTLSTDVGTRYWFVVEYEKEGQSVRSQPVTADPIEPLPAPENLKAEVREDGTVHLTWDTVENAAGYRIYFSASPIWTLQTEWFSCSGESGNDELRLEEGDTLTIWVCAESGGGPNLRAKTTATRGEAMTDDELRVLASDDTFSLYLSDSVLDDLSTEGMEPEQAEDFLAKAEALKTAIADYNTALDQLVTFVEENYGDLNVYLDGGDLYYYSPRTSFRVSGDALELLSGDYTTGEWTAETDGSATIEIISGGESYYLTQDESGISLTPNGGRGGRRNLGDSSEKISDEWNALEESNPTMEQRWDEWSDALDVLDLALSALKEYANSDLGGLNELVEGITTIKELLNIPRQRAKVINAHRMLAELNDIASHGHPTAMESQTGPSRDIAAIIRSKLNAARWALRSEMANNIYGMYSGIKGFVDLAKKLSVGEQEGSNTLEKINAFVASKVLSSRKINSAYEKAHQMYEEVRNYDRELHYEVHGVVQDRYGNHLNGVRVIVLYSNDGYGEEDLETTTDENGYYFVEVPWDPAALRFVKTGYLAPSWAEEVHVTPNMIARKDVTMDRFEWGTVTGTVTDEFGKPLKNVDIHAGEYINGKWEFSGCSDNNGIYTISLPSGKQTIYATLEGYRTVSKDVDVIAYDTCRQDFELGWGSGVKGTVMCQDGPGERIKVQFYRYGGGTVGGTYTDANGQYRYRLEPGVYSVGVGQHDMDYINVDRTSGECYVEEITISENTVSEYNFNMEHIAGKHWKLISVNVLSQTYHPHGGGWALGVNWINVSYSWENNTVLSTKSSMGTCPPCIVVSDSKDVTVHVIGTFEYEGVVYSAEKTIQLDLDAYGLPDMYLRDWWK